MSESGERVLPRSVLEMFRLEGRTALVTVGRLKSLGPVRPRRGFLEIVVPSLFA